VSIISHLLILLQVLLIGGKQQFFTGASMGQHLDDLSPEQTDQAHLDHLFDTAILASPEQPPPAELPMMAEAVMDEQTFGMASMASMAAPVSAMMTMAAEPSMMRSRRAAPRAMMASNMSRAMPGAGMQADMMMAPDDFALDEDVSERDSMARRQLYQPPDETKEYGERRYWGVKPGNSTTHLVTVNQFWVECAKSMTQGQPSEALSASWMLACEESINATLLALAMLQVPLTNIVNRQHAEQGLVLRTQGSAVVYAKQIRYVCMHAISVCLWLGGVIVVADICTMQCC
jgi:hypothetical protein